MCGIAGVLDPARRGDDHELASVVDAMAQPLIPRGPDSADHWVDAAHGLAFGHRRLAVVDLSEHGVQPMSSRDGRWIINFNGEIYNHRELAADLAATGVAFHGHCDTEILVEAIAHWGLVPTLDRVDGMYAFALWDRDRRELTLVRDRIGEKPLYYGRLGSGEVVFASTLDAIRAHPRFDRPVDRDALALFFRHSYVPAPWSIYTDILKLEPGTTVVVSAGGEVGRPTPYWSLLDVAANAPEYTGSEADAVAELDRLMRASVERRLVADVPVGAFLSGGIDSGAVVAVAQAVTSTPLRTYTVGSTEGDFDESAEASSIARHLGTSHSELIVADSDALAVVQGITGIHDEPFADSSQIPMRIVSQMARESVTVALSGDGGDELFGGYNRYTWADSIWHGASRVPRRARLVGAKMARLLPQRGWDRLAQLLPDDRRPQQLGLKISKVLDVADSATGEELFHRLTSDWLRPDLVIPGSVEPPTMHTDPSRWPRTSSLVEHMMLVDALTFLPDDILTKVDRAAMSVSLETRLPYLDRQIIEFATSLPVSMKIRNGVSKWPLRQVLAQYVPDELTDRPKSGFGLPIDSWLRGPLRSWATELLEQSPAMEILDRGIIRRTWEDHLSGRRNNAYLLWDVLMFADWCDHRGITELGGSTDTAVPRDLTRS